MVATDKALHTGFKLEVRARRWLTAVKRKVPLARSRDSSHPGGGCSFRDSKDDERQTPLEERV